METTSPHEGTKLSTSSVASWRIILKNTASILGTLLLFLLAIELLITSVQHLGAGAAQSILVATSNPFTALFIGLLVTAILQSSSATTSMTVALVASGSLNLTGAVPLIIGANIGTTITSTLVSLGFINRKKEFKRAVTAGTYHDFFNITTSLVLFPLEYHWGFLSGLSYNLASLLPEQGDAVAATYSITDMDRLIDMFGRISGNGFIAVIISFILLFGSIVLFRRTTSAMLGLRGQDRVISYFFRSPARSFVSGLLVTAAVRSSTITTSLVVPLFAKKAISLKGGVVPFILGANLGTTITAFIASISSSSAAMSIAIAHFLFNFIGVLLYGIVPLVRSIPVRLARGLGSITKRHRLAGFAYIIITFFLIPFSLIFLNKEQQQIKPGESMPADSVLMFEKVYSDSSFLSHITTENLVPKMVIPTASDKPDAPVLKAANATPPRP